MNIFGDANLLRERDCNEAKVFSVELFFDLVYVFAVTQLSQYLLDNLTLLGGLQTLVLWFAVWLGWQYTSWVTNWFNPDTRHIRFLLFAIMLLGLLMAVALPEAFGERGFLFAAAYIAIQVGRTLFVSLHLKKDHPLSANFRRILAWLCISTVFWLLGAFNEGEWRLYFWAIAVACEYGAPFIGFWLPQLGRSKTSEWTIEGGLLAERCQLFVIVALGETILATGKSLGHLHHWNVPVLIAFFVSFIGSIAMWWVYFNIGSEAGTHTIVKARDPGKIGAYYHFVHVFIVAGIILTAVGSELTIASPAMDMNNSSMWVLFSGPLVYLLALAAYKTVVNGVFPLSNILGIVALILFIPWAFKTDLLMVSAVVTVVLCVVAILEGMIYQK